MILFQCVPSLEWTFSLSLSSPQFNISKHSTHYCKFLSCTVCLNQVYYRRHLIDRRFRCMKGHAQCFLLNEWCIKGVCVWVIVRSAPQITLCAVLHRSLRCCCGRDTVFRVKALINDETWSRHTHINNVRFVPLSYPIYIVSSIHKVETFCMFVDLK